MARIKLRLQHNEREFEISKQLQALHIDDGQIAAECQLIHQEGDSFVLEWQRDDGLRQHIHVAGSVHGDSRQLWVDGRLYYYERVTPRREQDRSGALSSTIPAVVSELLVGEGDAVTSGQKLILLESMKMVIPIQAPYDGIVTAVHCAAGDAVQAGANLIDLERATEK